MPAIKMKTTEKQSEALCWLYYDNESRDWPWIWLQSATHSREWNRHTKKICLLRWKYFCFNYVRMQKKSIRKISIFIVIASEVVCFFLVIELRGKASWTWHAQNLFIAIPFNDTGKKKTKNTPEKGAPLKILEYNYLMLWHVLGKCSISPVHAC